MNALPELPNVAVLSPLVTRVLGQNAGYFCLQGTNTYLVGSPHTRDRVLIDTGDGRKEYSDLLKQYLQSTGERVRAILLTHWHGDHVGGVDSVTGLLGYEPPIYKMANERDERTYKPLTDGQVLEYCGVRLTALYTPGHVDDHFCFWLEEENALFSGDNILGHGTTIFSDYGRYISSLRRLGRITGLSRIYPGHGQLISDGPAKVAEYLKHRLDREAQVVEALRGLKDPASATEITRIVYGDQSPQVLESAERVIQLYLAKLEEDGVAEADNGKWCSRSELHSNL